MEKQKADLLCCDPNECMRFSFNEGSQAAEWESSFIRSRACEGGENSPTKASLLLVDLNVNSANEHLVVMDCSLEFS